MVGDTWQGWGGGGDSFPSIKLSCTVPHPLVFRCTEDLHLEPLAAVGTGIRTLGQCVLMVMCPAPGGMGLGFESQLCCFSAV